MINTLHQLPSYMEPFGSGAPIASPCIEQGDLNLGLDMVTPSIEYTDYDIPLLHQISVALSLDSNFKDRDISGPI